MIYALRLEKLYETCAAVLRELDISNAYLADIGCDHSYLGIMLCSRMDVEINVIAADIGTGPLSIAAENIKRSGLDSRIRTRLSDGLKEFEPYETDVIVISGMGAELIMSILDSSPDVVRSSKRLILMPHTKQQFMRYYARRRGLKLIREESFFEAPKYYHIMTFSPEDFCISVEINEPAADMLSDADLFGSSGEDELLHELDLLKKNLEALGKADSEQAKDRYHELEILKTRYSSYLNQRKNK